MIIMLFCLCCFVIIMFMSVWKYLQSRNSFSARFSAFLSILRKSCYCFLNIKNFYSLWSFLNIWQFTNKWFPKSVFGNFLDNSRYIFIGWLWNSTSYNVFTSTEITYRWWRSVCRRRNFFREFCELWGHFFHNLVFEILNACFLSGFNLLDFNVRMKQFITHRFNWLTQSLHGFRIFSGLVSNLHVTDMTVPWSLFLDDKMFIKVIPSQPLWKWKLHLELLTTYFFCW